MKSIIKTSKIEKSKLLKKIIKLTKMWQRVISNKAEEMQFVPLYMMYWGLISASVLVLHCFFYFFFSPVLVPFYPTYF